MNNLILYVVGINLNFVGLLTMFIISLRKVKAGRDSGVVAQCLAALEESARSGQGNLLELAVAAARARYHTPSHTPPPSSIVTRY
jgi:methylmalonyl-CoA mutase